MAIKIYFVRLRKELALARASSVGMACESNALRSMKKTKTKTKKKKMNKVLLSEQYEYYASLDVGVRQMRWTTRERGK